METKQAFDSQPHNDQTHKSLSSYEKSREERIKKNLQRMQQLGLSDLSNKLKSLVTPPKRSFRPKSTSTKLSSPLPPSGPPRRSSRLQNVTPVSYSENLKEKKKGLLDVEDIELVELSKPEIYTEEHEKLLGNTSRSWTFFVDGYAEDGKRIYDPVNGKTCHQCRQKTLGYRTNCSKCQIVQGQFCGDCLYMRYGEHVLEAIEDPNWICPVCRGICNCSLCRQAKGLVPTGHLYRKISRLGYKSVAHYLIQTRRAQTSEENLPAASQISVGRSLPFSTDDTPLEGESEVRPLEPQVKDKLCGTVETGKEEELPGSEIQEVSNIPPESRLNKVASHIKPETRLQFDVSKPESENAESNLEKEKVKVHYTDTDQENKNNLVENFLSTDAADSNCKLHDKLEYERKKLAERKEELDVNVKEKKGSNNSMPKISQKLTRKRALSMEQSSNSIAASETAKPGKQRSMK